MGELKLKLLSPDGNTLWGESLFPEDMLPEDVVAELVEQLELSVLNKDGQRIEYRLRVRDVDLQPGKSLREQQVVDKDTLQLISSAPAPAPAAPPKPLIEQPKGDTVEVILSVLDVNAVGKPTTFSLDMAVGEAIHDIIRNYKLPVRDPATKRLIDYRLSSKAHRRELLNEETFRSARIPNRDRLNLAQHAVAG